MVVVDSEKIEPVQFHKKRKIAQGFFCPLHFLHAWKESKLLSYGWNGSEDLPAKKLVKIHFFAIFSCYDHKYVRKSILHCLLYTSPSPRDA